MSPIAQETPTDTTTPGVELDDPSRPFTEWFIDLVNADPDGPTAAVLGVVVEPVIQIAIAIVVTLVVTALLRWVSHRLIARAKEDRLVTGIGSSIHLGDKEVPVSTRRVQRLDALSAVIDSVIAVVVWSVALLTILGVTFGINLAPLIAGAGILGVALGFGAQDLVKDFISGLFMLAEDQFGVGDIIDVGEATGMVESVSLRSTRLRDLHGTVWHVPNGEIRRVGNLSQEWSRALLDVGIAYGADVDRAAAVIKAAADEVAAEDAFEHLILDEPEVWGVEELGDSAVAIRLVVKTAAGQQWTVARELRRRIKLHLDEANIEIPFPQRTVWFRPDAPPEALQSSYEEVLGEPMSAPEETGDVDGD
ncbi:MAG: mechanosensitive ion channel family protein [Acidimicrobiia bacterium]